MEDTLRIEAFPAYPKTDFPDLKNYSGIKVFPVDDFIAISYFINEGHKDSSGRPILSARVALIPKEQFNTCGRDLEAVKMFLKGMKIETASSQFANFINEKSAKEEEFIRLINSLGEELPTKAIDCMLSYSKVNIHYNKDKSLAESLVRLAYLLLPIDVIASNSYSSDCSYISSPQRENYILTQGRVSEDKKKEVSFLDVDSGKASRGKYSKKLNKIIKEIASGREWYTFTWEEKYSLFLKLIEAWFSGRRVKIIETSEKLRRMKETINIVKQLEKV